MKKQPISEGIKYQKDTLKNKILSFLHECYWGTKKDRFMTITSIIWIIILGLWRWWTLAFIGAYILIILYFRLSWWWASYQKLKTDAFMVERGLKDVYNK